MYYEVSLAIYTVNTTPTKPRNVQRNYRLICRRFASQHGDQLSTLVTRPSPLLRAAGGKMGQQPFSKNQQKNEVQQVDFIHLFVFGESLLSHCSPCPILPPSPLPDTNHDQTLLSVVLDIMGDTLRAPKTIQYDIAGMDRGFREGVPHDAETRQSLGQLCVWLETGLFAHEKKNRPQTIRRIVRERIVRSWSDCCCFPVRGSRHNNRSMAS